MMALKNSLKGIKVLDASSVLAGPSVATYFAELGAEVIKIEHPNHPDVTRSWKLGTENPDASVSAYFSSVNYKKTYRQIDLKSEDGKLEFKALMREADILVMNFKRSDYEKFSLTDEAIRAINPKLIVGKISGYGKDNDRVAYDLILQAESGFMSMNGQADGPPTKMPIAFVDILAAHHLKEAILLALFQRERTGFGEIINVSLYDAAVSSLVNQASNYIMANHVPQRIGSKHPNIAPYGELFQTKDDRTITFAIGSDQHFEKLCSVLKQNELPKDARFISNQMRVKHREELFEILEKSVAQVDSDELLDKLETLNVPAGAVKNLKEVFKQPEAQSLIREEVIDGVNTKRIASVIFN